MCLHCDLCAAAAAAVWVCAIVSVMSMCVRVCVTLFSGYDFIVAVFGGCFVSFNPPPFFIAFVCMNVVVLCMFKIHKSETSHKIYVHSLTVCRNEMLCPLYIFKTVSVWYLHYDKTVDFTNVRMYIGRTSPRVTSNDETERFTFKVLEILMNLLFGKFQKEKKWTKFN